MTLGMKKYFGNRELLILGIVGFLLLLSSFDFSFSTSDGNSDGVFTVFVGPSMNFPKCKGTQNFFRTLVDSNLIKTTCVKKHVNHVNFCITNFYREPFTIIRNEYPTTKKFVGSGATVCMSLNRDVVSGAMYLATCDADWKPVDYCDGDAIEKRKTHDIPAEIESHTRKKQVEREFSDEYVVFNQ